MAEKKQKNNAVSDFRINKVKSLADLYSDDQSTRNRYNQSRTGSRLNYEDAAQVRTALKRALNNLSVAADLSEQSKQLFAINPIYASVINYLSNMFMWRYKVTPHKVFKKTAAKLNKDIKEEDYKLLYYKMVEVADGLAIETKFPAILSLLFIEGAVYFTTYCDEETLTIDTLLLPIKYCRKIGETQYGSAIIEFNFSYFQNLGLSQDALNRYFKSFPKEFKTGYNRFLQDNTKQWQRLDPHFSTGVLLNDYQIPTYFYLLGGILDFEQYQDNELERNENLLKYLVTQKMPIYQDKLIFEEDEVAALHKSLRKIIDKGEKTRLITTYGDVELLKVSENDTAENQVLSKSFKAIFNNAGFNSAVFTAESVEALKLSLIRDKGLVWRYVQTLLNFYTIAINNAFDFKGYQADIDILPISPYTYHDDIKVYKENATLGVGKLDYIIASGIKQKNIEDNLKLESMLKLNEITPMQTAYTQTAEDRVQSEDQQESDVVSKPGIEPSDVETPEDKTDEDK